MADYASYIHFPDIKGESTDVSHLHWIEVFDYYFGDKQVSPSGLGTAAAGRGENTFSIVKKVDTTTPRLVSAAINGDHLPLVEFAIVEKLTGTGQGRTRTVSELHFDDVIVGNVFPGGPPPPGMIPVEQVRLHFKKVTAIPH